MPFIRHLVVALFVCKLACHAVLAAEVMRVRVTHWPPQYFKDSNNQWTGVDVELIQAILAEAELPLEFHSLPWARAVASLRDGEIDILPTFDQTQERAAYTRWIGPQRLATMGLVIRKGDAFVLNSLDDLVQISRSRKQLFGHQQGIFISTEFNYRLEHDDAFKRCFDIAFKEESNLAKLERGRLLGFFEEINAARYRIQFDPKYKKLDLHDFKMTPTPTYFGVRKSLHPETFDRIHNAYEKLERQGKLNSIRKKWGYL